MGRPTPVPPLRCGFDNIGGWSCFVNSTLQAMMSVPLIRTFLLRRGHSSPSCPSSASRESCVFCSLEDLAEEHAAVCATAQQAADSADSPTLRPISIVAKLQALDAGLEPGTHHDAQEFFGALVRGLQAASLGQAAREAISVEPGVAETTAISQMICGWLARTISCPDCGHVRTAFERFTEISAEITQATDTLHEALRSFSAPEKLDRENLLQCESCKRNVRAETRMTIAQAPPVLCIHLKRFRPGFLGKVNKFIEFPERLGLLPYMSPGTKTVDAYKLCAVVVHLDVAGITFFGHYIAFVCDSRGQWFLADDRHVKKVTAQQVLSMNGYILLYQRTSTVSPSSLSSSGQGTQVTVGTKKKKKKQPQRAEGSDAGDGGSPASVTTSTASAVATDAQVPAKVQSPPPQSSSPSLCKAGCGFFGREDTRGLCSQCFGKQFPEEHKKMSEEKAARQKLEELQKRAIAADTPDPRPVQPQQPATAPRQQPVAQQPATASQTQKKKIGRNDPCFCGSGLKFKSCHFGKT